MPRPVNRFRRAGTIAGVLLLLVVSVPVFVGSVHGQSVTDSTGGSQTSLLVSAIVSLNQQIDALSGEVRSLRSAVGSIGQTTQTAVPSLGEGMPECLTACRAKMSSCLLASQSTSTAAFRTAAPGTGSVGGLDACRNQANTCMNQCAPRTAQVLSCQDRCAVALGACVVGARGDARKLTACREANSQCLVNACRPGATSDSRAFLRVPAAACADSCDRDLEICRRAFAYDTTQLTACEATAKTCREKVCAAVSSATPSSPSALNQTPGQQLTVQCENTCTATFNDCRASAGGNADRLATCDTSYGSCRNTCLTQIGGGY